MNNHTIDCIRRADELQQQAGRVLAELQLRQRWEQVGETFLVGSARFGLMASSNLDFEIYVQEPDIRAGFAIIRELAALPGVMHIEFHNFMVTPDPGLYWRIDYQDSQGLLWDIDNWLVPYRHPHAGMADHFAAAMQQTLTDETRKTILEIKAQRTPENKIRGIDIYKAVLSGGVHTMEELTSWLSAHPPAAMETWCP